MMINYERKTRIDKETQLGLFWARHDIGMERLLKETNGLRVIRV
jgi:hypothetical protein